MLLAVLNEFLFHESIQSPWKHTDFCWKHCVARSYTASLMMKIVKNLLLLFILILLASSFIWCPIIFVLEQTVNDQSCFLSACHEILQLSYFPFIISFSRWKSPSLLSCSLYVSSIPLIIFVALLWTFSSSTMSFLRWGGPQLHPVFKMRANHGSTQ